MIRLIYVNDQGYHDKNCIQESKKKQNQKQMDL